MRKKGPVTRTFGILQNGGKYILTVFGAAILALTIANPLTAQDARGSVQGIVTDEGGGVISGVAVTLSNDAMGTSVSRQTSNNGRYIFYSVDPGIYTITAKMQGFKTIVQKNVTVTQRGDITVDMSLEVAAVEEIVTVEESPVNVQFNTSHRDLAIEQKLFSELPIATRNPATLATLDSSVDGDFGRNSNIDHYAAQAYDIGGRTRGQNDILIDGSPLTNSAKIGYNPPIDTVAEYKVIQNAVDAEYGHSAGGIVTMAMKSGTNTVHGSAYYFGSDPDLNAMTDRITRSHSQNTYWNGGATLGLPLIKNKLFLFSAFEAQTDTNFSVRRQTLPTALERQGDFSQSYYSDGTLRIIYDPMTSRIENGKVVRDPFPGNKIPADRWDSLAVRLLDNVPLPNSDPDNLSGLNNFQADYYRYYRYFNISNRIDWQVNDRWKMFARFSFFNTNQPDNDFYEGVDKIMMRYNEGSQRDGYNFAADTVGALSPTTVLTLSTSFYKTIDRRNYSEYAIGEEGYANLWPNRWWEPYAVGRPLIYSPNIQVRPTNDTFGVRNFWWQQPYGMSFGARLNKHFENHSVKLGTNVRLKRGNAARFYFANMIFTGDLTQDTTAGADSKTGHPWADFLLGALDPDTEVRGRVSSVDFIPLQEANSEMYAVYVQDDWKINRNLTLNLGLRYEYEPGYWDSQYRLPQQLDLNTPIPNMQEKIAPVMASTMVGDTGKTVADIMAESQGLKHTYNGAYIYTSADSKRATSNDKKQFMPRAGFAYRVDDKTAIRGGYGRFYSPPTLIDGGNEPLGQFDLGSGYSPQTRALPLVEGVPQAFLSDPFPQGLTPASGPLYGTYTNLGDAINIDQYERRPPISDRISLSVQREIVGRIVLDVTYMMNFVSRENLNNVDINEPDPRLEYKYKGELGRSVPNPFYNYETEETFPGGLRHQETIRVSDLLRPYPQYGRIRMSQMDIGAKYRLRSLTIRLQRPFSNGFAFLLSYSLNHEKQQQYYDDFDTYDRVLTWSDAPYGNPRHRIVASGTFEIPVGKGRRFGENMSPVLNAILGGWQVTGTFRYRSGNFLRFGGMIAPESVTKLGEPGKGNYWFDTTGFERLPAYTRRSNPVTYDNLTGPSFQNLDASISKSFSLPHGARLQVRLEAYNALNKMNWADPQLTVTRSDFGQTNSQLGTSVGRRLQYAIRLDF